MKNISFALEALLALALLAPARAQEVRVPMVDPWFTGSLVSPSPAIPVVGILGVEPYEVYTVAPAEYLSNGHRQNVADGPHSLQTFVSVKYAITDRLTFEVFPGFTAGWDDRGDSSGAQANDLPVDLEYQLRRQNNENGTPSLNVMAGMVFPTGDYDDLHSNADGFGQGVYQVRFGFRAQSLLNAYGAHPLRVRAWATGVQPVSWANLHGNTSYGTNADFHGRGQPGFSAELGISFEWVLSQRWVLAFDGVRDTANGTRVRGFGANDTPDGSSTGSSGTWSIAPAIEYNWSPNYGIIAGVQFSVAGHNAAAYVSPQIALNMVF